jgi:osmotically-inducible protein OsmY
MKHKEENIRLSERHYTSYDLEKIGKKVIFRHSPEELESTFGNQRIFLDERVKHSVLESLYRSTLLDASRIEVFVEDGKVTLKGSVKSPKEKNYAQDVIQFVPGVVEVFNDLIIVDHLFH